MKLRVLAGCVRQLRSFISPNLTQNVGGSTLIKMCPFDADILSKLSYGNICHVSCLLKINLLQFSKCFNLAKSPGPLKPSGFGGGM